MYLDNADASILAPDIRLAYYQRCPFAENKVWCSSQIVTSCHGSLIRISELASSDSSRAEQLGVGGYEFDKIERSRGPRPHV